MSYKWVIHAMAHCTKCGWSESDYKTAQKKASDHASRTGHKVKAEVAYAIEYG